MVKPSNGKYSVLLVDDSDVERLVLKSVLLENAKLQLVGEARNGDEAIAYLGGNAAFNDREKHPFPDLLLLDLEMPGKSGFDVLAWLQTQSFETLSVVVLSALSLPENIMKCTALGADAYHQKSPLRTRQLEMLRKVEDLLDVSH
jgi:CheY-like chemotaxis protein